MLRLPFSDRAMLSSTVWLSNTVGFWNFRPMPRLAISVSSCLVRSMLAVEKHLAGVRPRLAGYDVHHRRLAGAVGSDDGAHLALAERQRQIVERAESVEGHGNAVEIEDRVLSCCHRLTRRAAVG